MCESAKRRPRWKRVLRTLAAAAIVPLLGVPGLNCAATYLVRRTDTRIPRDPATGIMLGAEERDLGPKDAPGVAILVHGFIGAGDNFDGLPEAIADAGWRVRVMRLPGHGTSPIDFEKTSADALIEAVRDEAAAMHAEHDTVVLIGHSMGASLATIVAAGQEVEGVVLGAPYFGVTQKWFYLLPVRTWINVGSPFIKWLYKGQMFMQVNRPEAKDDITSYAWVGMEGTRTLMELGDRANAPELLARVTCPVLMIQSVIDKAADPAAAQHAFDQLGSERKEAVWLEKSNHIIFWDYEAAEVESAILEFLASLEVMAPTAQESES